MHRKEGQPLAALLFCPPMVTTLFALILVFLLSVSPAVGESGDPGDRPDTPSAVTPPPDACRDCGLQYYPPAATPPEAPAPAASNSPSKTASDVPVSAVPGRSHLSSDPRIRTARVLVQRNRFAQALKILRPLASSDHPDQTDVQFLLGLAAMRWSQEPDVEEEKRLALLDEAIAAFRSILIHRPDLVRVRLELALAFYLKEEDALARGHFDRVLVGQPPEVLVANINRGF